MILRLENTCKNWNLGNSLAVQWLGLRTSTAGGMGSIPGGRTKMLEATWCGQKRKRKKGKMVKMVNFTSGIIYHNWKNKIILKRNLVVEHKGFWKKYKVWNISGYSSTIY